MAILELLAAHKAAITVGSLTTAAVASAAVPVVLNYSAEKTDDRVGDGSEEVAPVPQPANIDRVQDVQSDVAVLLNIEKQAGVPAAQEDQDLPVDVDNNVYAKAVGRKDSLREKVLNYKSKVSWVSRKFVGIREWNDRLAKCRAKNYSDQQPNMYDFSGVYNTYVSVKADNDSLDRTLKDIDSGDLFKKYKAVEGNRFLSSFNEFDKHLVELEEEYSAIENGHSVDKFSKQLNDAITTLKKDLDKCDFLDIIRLNNEIGKRYLSGN